MHAYCIINSEALSGAGRGKAGGHVQHQVSTSSAAGRATHIEPALLLPSHILHLHCLGLTLSRVHGS
jgi:hypothetical protein